ncbi:MAG: hypothetical protein NT006_01040 [Candidatus Aminicenantes bacterium]|nr:hypothetical protein [Candidatus Aminicenantes bacterium]
MTMKRRLLIPLFLLLPTLLLTSCQSTSSPEPGVDVVVTVDGSAVLRELEPGLIFGANLGAWVSNTKLGATTQDLFRDLRPSVARFPGGNMSNNYCWVTQKVSGNDHVQWEDWSWGIGVGQYIAFLKAIGCVPMFSLNPFDHNIDGQVHSAASEAADLARLFVAEGFAGAYYEVGNENDGSWNPMLSINEYTDRFILLMTAVKAVDPSARAMGPVVSGYNMTWINGFLNRLQSLGALNLLDWVSYHHYGGWISNGNQNGIDLDDPQDFDGELETIRNALAGRGLSRVKIAVTEMNAAIWDEGCTRGQFTIEQGLWLADALGVSLMKADAANVWIHLHPGADPHSLIDDGATPPRPTKNYWPVALPAQTLSSSDPVVPIAVLAVTLDVEPSIVTGYAVRKADGSLGVLLINKSAESLEVAVDLPASPRGVTARRLGREEYDAGSGLAQLSVRVESRRATITLSATSMAGLDVR